MLPVESRFAFVQPYFVESPRGAGRRFPRSGFNPFMPTVPTFAVRETDVSRHNGVTSGAPLKPVRDDSALRTLSSLRGSRGAPRCPHYAEIRQSLGQQMLERWA